MTGSLKILGECGEYTSEFMKQSYKEGNSNVFDLMNNNGRLVFERSFIKEEYIDNIEVDKNKGITSLTYV